jgi:hypothetical protein
MLRRYPLIIVVTLLTCGKDASAPLPDEPGPPTDIAGLWSYTAYLENTARQIECHDAGRITISQDSADLTGPVTQAGSCNSTDGYFEYSGTGTLSGNVGAATVRLEFESCSYHGDLFNTPRDSAGGTVTCTITGPLSIGRLTLTGTWWAIKGIEALPPELTATIAWPPGDPRYFVTGETFRLMIRASDDRKLHSVVYNIGPPMNLYDSVLTRDTVFTDTVEVVVPASWAGEADVFVRAHDAGGGGQIQNIGTLRVLDGIRRPFQSRDLVARAAGAVYDSTRNALYVAQPESAQVGVLSLNSMTLGPRIHLPMTPAGYGSLGIDIVPGGDTVVVALPDSARLALLNRVTGTVTTTPITGGVQSTTDVVVTANRHALVFGARDSSGFTYFGIWDHDLATGTDTLRRDVGQNGHLNATAQMFRSPDQSKVLVYAVGAPACGYIYDVGSDSFSACQTFGVAGTALASATTNGSKWLWGNLLLDSALNVIATVPNLTGPWPEAPMFPGMAPDGSAAYLPTTYGYDKVALPSGTVLERVRVYWPFPITRATVFPEGNRLLLWSDLMHGMTGMYRAIVVDLN